MIEKLTKRQIRYACFRLQTEYSGGNKADLEYINEIRNNFESQKLFSGWQNFSKIWDVSNKNPLKIILLTESGEEKWYGVVEQNAKEIK